MSIQVRKFGQEDLDGCVEAVNSNFSESSKNRYVRNELADVFQDILRDPGAMILVAIGSEGEVLGLAAAVVHREIMDKQEPLIHVVQLAIRKYSETKDRNGPTHALLKAVRDAAIERGISKIQCKCKVDETEFYQNFGFKPVYNRLELKIARK